MATYKAKQAGKHLSLTVEGHRIQIHDSRNLNKGDEFEHPDKSFVMLIVAEPASPGARYD